MILAAIDDHRERRALVNHSTRNASRRSAAAGSTATIGGDKDAAAKNMAMLWVLNFSRTGAFASRHCRARRNALCRHPCDGELLWSKRPPRLRRAASDGKIRPPLSFSEITVTGSGHSMPMIGSSWRTPSTPSARRRPRSDSRPRIVGQRLKAVSEAFRNIELAPVFLRQLKSLPLRWVGEPGRRSTITS